jgi:dihydrofolate reductase
MQGGTTYQFVTDGIESALAQAREAATGGEVSVAGGAETVRQYLAAGLIDELRVHIAPMLIGTGERPLDGLGDLKLEQLKVSGSSLVTHVSYRVSR